MKRVFLVHQWHGTPETDWYPQLAEKLKASGFEVTVPEMPDTHNPKIPAWTSALAEVIKESNEDTYLVGHSIGCQTILRYLESLPAKEKTGGIVLVAPWVTLTGLEGDEKEIAEPWLSQPINFERAKKHSKKFTCIFSDNDSYVPMENAAFFKERLNAKLIIEKGKGHFTGEEGVKELPSALKELLEMVD